MGYWGTLITVRSGEEMPAVLRDRHAHIRQHDGARRGAGWLVYDVSGNVLGDDETLLRNLSADSAAPVVAAYIADSDYGQLIAASPSGERWGAWLAPRTAYAFERDHHRMDGTSRHVARRRALGTIASFGSPPAEAARYAVRWAAEAGYSVPARPIRQLLRTARPPGFAASLWLPWKRYVFAEDIYFDLLDCLGLPQVNTDRTD
jgi:hypothetical protein